MEIVAAIVFFIPAYIANMMPVLAGAIPLLKKERWHPIDFGVNLGKSNILGKNKTIEGFLLGLFGGMVGGFLIGLFSNLGLEAILLMTFFGLITGFGAMTGDLVGSFFKRRFKIKAGSTLPIVDQLDFVIGAWLFAQFPQGFGPASLQILAIGVLITPILHLLANVLAYWLKLKKVWW